MAGTDAVGVVDRSGHRIAYGPIPSRRLGRSLGVNNIPAKACSYACRYCQVGTTTEQTIEPRAFFDAVQIRDAVAAHLDRIRAAGLDADYLSIVPDGEPTLDSGLGESIEALRDLGVPIAVITNGSLLWREDVRDRLASADLVSVKVDSVREDVWRRVNGPHRNLDLEVILQGIGEFANGYPGTLITETMLVAGLNDSSESLTATAAFLATIEPRTAYLAVPIRPPVVAGTHSPGEAGLVRAYQAYSTRLSSVEMLTGHEVGDFAHTGDAREDLLAITAVHPMREAAVRRLLLEDGATWDLIEALLATDALRAVEHAGERFYLRPLHRGSAAVEAQ
jgi:wyosine [tRNA(Phe)-imidazoG37] synthetase (radical SAM superfamily)